MPSVIMSAVQTTLETILAEHQLHSPQIMSTSGTYYVAQVSDANGKQYLVKILQKDTPEKQAAFHREAGLLSVLSNNPGPLKTAEQVWVYTNTPALGLCYTLIPGDPLGWYYFYVSSASLVNAAGVGELVDCWQHIEGLVSDVSELQLSTLSAQELVTQQQQWLQELTSQGDVPAWLSTTAQYTAVRVDNWLEHPVLAHADCNPKNIIATKPTPGFAFIDWSDATLGPRYYDVAFFWLACWRQPQLQNDIIAALQPSKQFWQLVTYWLPKFWLLLEDTERALQEEYSNGHIPQVALDDNVAYVQQAKRFYQQEQLVILQRAEM